MSVARFVPRGDGITRELEENLERLTLDIPDTYIDDLPLRYQRPTAGVPGRFSRLLCRVAWAVMCYHSITRHCVHEISTESYLLKADSFGILYGDFCLKAYVLQMRSRDLFFVNMFIYIYRLLPGVYMSQMVNVFYMSFMCL